eukprot:5327394-Amphidinium_carterae.1
MNQANNRAVAQAESPRELHTPRTTHGKQLVILDPTLHHFNKTIQSPHAPRNGNMHLEVPASFDNLLTVTNINDSLRFPEYT